MLGDGETVQAKLVDTGRRGSRPGDEEMVQAKLVDIGRRGSRPGMTILTRCAGAPLPKAPLPKMLGL